MGSFKKPSSSTVDFSNSRFSCSSFQEPKGPSRSRYRSSVSSSRVERNDPFTNTPNPDPNNYRIEEVKTIGKYLIVRVQYPDCTNYEGQKILVYEDVSVEDLINQKLIDPHFCNNKKFKSPVARFVPTVRGQKMAIIFAQAMGSL